MRLDLKLAIVATGMKNQRLAIEANKHLVPSQHLSELAITKIITNRKDPSPDQAKALASVLGKPVTELFPEVKS